MGRFQRKILAMQISPNFAGNSSNKTARSSPRESLPQYDMVVTLTGLDLARKKNGRMTRATTGYAYVGGACVTNSRLSKISSVAVVEDSGAFSGVVVTAHEVAHLLGVVHDGDAAPSYLWRSPGAQDCPWSQGYMMSDLRRTVRGLQWSPCSVRQMRHFLKTPTASCLYNEPVSQAHPLAGGRSLPGAGLSLDAQCYADRGTRACYHDSRVCTQLACYQRGNSGSCWASRPAAEGSSCGRGKHCLGGKCARITQSYSGQTTRKPKSIKDQGSGGLVKDQAKTTRRPAYKNRWTKTTRKNTNVRQSTPRTTSKNNNQRPKTTRKNSYTRPSTPKQQEMIITENQQRQHPNQPEETAQLQKHQKYQNIKIINVMNKEIAKLEQKV